MLTFGDPLKYDDAGNLGEVAPRSSASSSQSELEFELRLLGLGFELEPEQAGSRIGVADFG